MAEMERRRRIWTGNPPSLCAAVGFAPDPWQADVLASIRHPSPNRPGSQTLLACSRQAGKSTIMAIAIIRALLHRDALVLCCAPSERQAKLLFAKTLRYWRALGRVIPATSVQRTSLQLANGSELVVLPGNEDTVRGFSGVSLLCLDEAGGIPDSLYSALAPVLSVSGGALIAGGTPRGQRGWFYDQFDGTQASDPSVARFLIPATQCPRISPAFLAQEKLRLGELIWQQEYCVGDCWLADSQAAFPSWAIDQTLTDGISVDRDLFAAS